MQLCPLINCFRCVNNYSTRNLKCVFYYKIKLNKTIQCVDECPEQFYADEETRECNPCHVQCKGCTGPTDEDCIACKSLKTMPNMYETKTRNTSKSRCIGVCLNQHFETQDGFAKMCIPCHNQCDSCFGPTDQHCHDCKTFKVTHEGNDNVSTHCVEKCPKDKPHIDGSEKSCIKLPGVSPAWIIGTIIATMSSIVIIAGLAYCIWKKKLLDWMLNLMKAGNDNPSTAISLNVL